VIEVSQLRRAVRESDKDRAPRIEELKESGGLEEAADVVALLHSTEQQKREQRERQYGPVTCAIAKHRGGPVSEIELSFAGRHLKFFSEA
jgi:replicative DNA helicase